MTTNHEFLQDMQGLFAKHGKPKPEDHSAGIFQILVLQTEAMEVLLTTMAELKGLANTQADKLAQLEADHGALIAKVGGGSGAPAAGGLTVTQEELDGLGVQISANNDRIDAMVKSVVSGVQTPVTPPPAPVVGLTPGVQTTPLAQATQPAAAPAAPAAPATGL